MLLWLFGPPMSSSRSTAASTSSGMPLNHFISSSTPVAPPSWLAPLSDMTTRNVLSSRPIEPRNVDQPADLRVGVVEEGRVRLLQPRGEAALVLGQLAPRAHAGIARRELRVGAESRRAPSAARTTARARRPSPRRSGRGTSRGTRAAPGAASESRRTRDRGRTAARARARPGRGSCRSTDRPGPPTRGSRPRAARGGSIMVLSRVSSGWNWSVSPCMKP